VAILREFKMAGIVCRVCGKSLKETFADLKFTPIANELIEIENKGNGETYYPLHVMVCEGCWLVQLDYTHPPKNIFSDAYPYFSSWSTSWLKHAEDYVEHILKILDLKKSSLIVEVASNDGYLLQFFKKREFEVLGIEPCENLAEISRSKNITTISKFFNEELAKEILNDKGYADLIVANNVLAHVPDTIDFLKGFKFLLNKNGIITFEFPYLFELITNNQYDTIYHEHYFYFSVHSVRSALARAGLKVYDIDFLKTHGGSVRLYVCHVENPLEESLKLTECIKKELILGVHKIDTYKNFQRKILSNKFDIVQKLIEIKNNNKKIIGYGAPAKGNTFLNYCGIGIEYLDYTVDISTQKQGKYLPGSRLEIKQIEQINIDEPDYILILPWNLSAEIISQISYVREWGCKFIVAIPEFQII
jgi:SAM-dependent methyltransferase